MVLRLLRKQDARDIASIVEAAKLLLPRLGDQWSLIRLVGHRQGSGHKLVAEDLALRWQHEIAEAVLAAGPEELAAEPELPLLISLALEHDDEASQRR